MVVFGGMGSLTGSIVSAVGLTILPELLRAFSAYRMLVYSVVLVLVMVFRPQGLFGNWEFSLPRLVNTMVLSALHVKMRGKLAASAKQHDQESGDKTVKEASTIQRRQGGAGTSEPILKAEHLGITFGGLKAVSNFNMTINARANSLV